MQRLSSSAMRIVDEVRAKAMIDKQDHVEKVERFHLEVIIGMFAWRNGHFWETADFLYYRHLEKYLKWASNGTFEKRIETMPDNK